MSGPFGSQQALASRQKFYSHEIGSSARLDNNAYYSRTPSSSGNQKTWTWSAWIKNYGVTSGGYLLSAGASGNREFLIYFDSTHGRLNIYQYSSGAVRCAVITSAKFRDPAAWYHFVVAVDTTQATASNRVKIYINGEQATALATATYPAQNLDTLVSSTDVHDIGKNAYNQNVTPNFYITEVNYINGSALAPTSFGETKADAWVPKKYASSYGSHDYYLDFATRATDPIDASGSSNNWSSTNVVATDLVPDSPTNNFATLNPLGPRRHAANYGTGTLTQGNLTITSTSNSYFDETEATIFPKYKGKWYYEIRLDQNQGNGGSGYTQFNIGGLYMWEVYSPAAQIIGSNGTYNFPSSSFSNGDIFMFALDHDNSLGWFGRNGQWIATMSETPDPAAGTGEAVRGKGGRVGQIQIRSSTSSLHRTVTANFGQDSSFAGQVTAQNNTDANGLGDFYYSPPEGYLALCTANLADLPTAIDPDLNNSPQDHFNTVLYTGNGATTRTITGVGFDPDFVWQKSRSSVIDHNLIDRLRGSGSNLSSDANYAEYGAGSNGAMKNVETDGASILAGSSSANNVNQSGQTYVLWNWKLGGAGVANNDGNIPSTVSANTDTGVSIATWTGNGTKSYIGHGLGQTPKVVFWKRRNSTENWSVQSSVLGTQKELELSGAGALSSTDTRLGSTANWTSSVVELGTYVANNASGGTYVGFCFAEVEGFSSFGNYNGNANTHGPFIDCGFSPAWVLLKNTSAAEWWSLFDNKRLGYNETNSILSPNVSNAEYSSSGGGIDILSNGFKVRGTSANYNGSGNTIFYMAFAEMPFKYANAR